LFHSVIFGRRRDAHSEYCHFSIDALEKYLLPRGQMGSQQLLDVWRVVNIFAQTHFVAAGAILYSRCDVYSSTKIVETLI